MEGSFPIYIIVSRELTDEIEWLDVSLALDHAGKNGMSCCQIEADISVQNEIHETKTKGKKFLDSLS